MEIPPELWRKVRLAAFERGISAKRLATELIEQGLQGSPPGVPERQAAKKALDVTIQGDLLDTWLPGVQLHEVSLVEPTPGNVAAGITPGLRLREASQQDVHQVGEPPLRPIDPIRPEVGVVGEQGVVGVRPVPTPDKPIALRMIDPGFGRAAPKPGPGRVAAAGPGAGKGGKPNRSTIGTIPDDPTTFRPVPKPGKKP